MVTHKGIENAVMQTLVNCEIRSLPVDISSITQFYEIKVITYSESKLYELFGVNKLTSNGFILKEDGSRFIFIDEKISKIEKRRTVSHELGHSILGHKLNFEEYYKVKKLALERQSITEMNADESGLFTLAPACVLLALKVHRPEQIMSLCKIPKKQAQLQAERLKVLYSKNLQPNSLEEKVLMQFQNFISCNQIY